MARIMQEEFLTDGQQETEGYMVAIDADTYAEARAIAYRKWAENKPEVMRRIREERESRIDDYWLPLATIFDSLVDDE